MPPVQQGKSAFGKALGRKKAVLKKASQEVAGGFAEDEQILEVFGLQEDGDQESCKCKVTGIKVGVHEGGTNKGKPYVTVQYAPLEEPAKGLTLSDFIPCYSRSGATKGEITEESMKYVYFLFQRLGYDTATWGDDPGQIEKAAKEVTKAKPIATVGVVAAFDKKNDCLRVNLRLNRLHSAETAGADDEGQDVDDEETQSAAEAHSTSVLTDGIIVDVNDGEEEWQGTVQGDPYEEDGETFVSVYSDDYEEAYAVNVDHCTPVVEEE